MKRVVGMGRSSDPWRTLEPVEVMIRSEPFKATTSRSREWMDVASMSSTERGDRSDSDGFAGSREGSLFGGRSIPSSGQTERDFGPFLSAKDSVFKSLMVASLEDPHQESFFRRFRGSD